MEGFVVVRDALKSAKKWPLPLSWLQREVGTSSIKPGNSRLHLLLPAGD